jgi:phosphatidylglycerophosphate synthase
MKAELKNLVYSRGKWVKGADDAATSRPVTLAEIWRFYGNLVDYVRVVLVLAAAWTITVPAPFTTALLILTSILLDWIDGPLARYYDQCTIFGSGVDWLADVLGQVVTLCWWAQLEPRVLPWILAFTGVEMALSIFDFATTAVGVYPVYEGKLSKRYNSFFAIIDWAIPSGSYSWFGTFLWLTYPAFCLVCCLRLAQPAFGTALLAAQTILLLPALLYVWCETAYLCFILGQWRELPRK